MSTCQVVGVGQVPVVGHSQLTEVVVLPDVVLVPGLGSSQVALVVIGEGVMVVFLTDSVVIVMMQVVC